MRIIPKFKNSLKTLIKFKFKEKPLKNQENV